MIKKKQSANRNSRESKKAIVIGTDKKSPTVILFSAAFAVAIAAGLCLFFFTGNGTSSPPVAGTGPVSPTIHDGRITHAVSLFADGRARHFQYADADSKTTISYFILKSSDGIIRAAFDACDVCWRSGKGYYQEGESMVCRNCARRFESVLVNEVQGGCNPAPLKRTIENGQVVIRVEDIKKGFTYFNFSSEA